MELFVWSKFSKLVKFNAFWVDVGAHFLVYFTQSVVNTVRRSKSMLTWAVICLFILSCLSLSILVCSALWLGWFLPHNPPPDPYPVLTCSAAMCPWWTPKDVWGIVTYQTVDSVYFNRTHIHYNLPVCCFLYRASWNTVKEKKFF